MASSGFLSVLGFVRRLLGSTATRTTVDGSPDPGARLTYGSDGRSGRVQYQSPRAKFTMYYEFGGGDCVATVDLPSPATWERQTGLPLDQRDAVIDWIGRQIVRDQISSGRGRFVVNGGWLEIYSG
jgi:hypothetical protein